MSLTTEKLPAAMERGGFEPIPPDRREGRESNQFFIWFGSQMHMSALVLGGIGILLGLGLAGTILAIVAGNIIGALGNSICATMGPRLGIPQMVISRMTFGRRGNYVPSFLTTLLYIGWATVGIVLSAEAIQQIWGVNAIIPVFIIALVAVLLALYGYHIIHRYNRWLTIASIVVFAILTVLAASHITTMPAVPSATRSNYVVVWLVEFTIALSFTISWAPYASDYSRYLPKSVSYRKVYWFSFAALALATSWVMSLGALLTAAVKVASIPAVHEVAGGFAYVAYPVLIISQLTAVVYNLYSGSLATLAWDFPAKRWVLQIAIGVIAFVLAAVLGGPSFVVYYKDFLFLISYFVTPWLAILGLDFYWRHRRSGRLDLPAPSDYYQSGGPMDGVRWAVLACMLLGIAVSVPFMATNLFTGPIGNMLQGADLSYFVSFIVAGVSYYVLMRGNHSVIPKG